MKLNLKIGLLAGSAFIVVAAALVLLAAYHPTNTFADDGVPLASTAFDADAGVAGHEPRQDSTDAGGHGGLDHQIRVNATTDAVNDGDAPVYVHAGPTQTSGIDAPRPKHPGEPRAQPHQEAAKAQERDEAQERHEASREPRHAPQKSAPASLPEQPAPAAPEAPSAPTVKQDETMTIPPVEQSADAPSQGVGGVQPQTLQTPGEQTPETCGLDACHQKTHVEGASLDTPAVDSQQLQTPGERAPGHCGRLGCDIEIDGMTLGSTPAIRAHHVGARGFDLPAICRIAPRACLRSYEAPAETIGQTPGVPGAATPGASVEAREGPTTLDVRGGLGHTQTYGPYALAEGPAHAKLCNAGCSAPAMPAASAQTSAGADARLG